LIEAIIDQIGMTGLAFSRYGETFKDPCKASSIC